MWGQGQLDRTNRDPAYIWQWGSRRRIAGMKLDMKLIVSQSGGSCHLKEGKRQIILRQILRF
jgi:hypothetical protein